MSSEAINKRIAQRLKNLRKERGWSLDTCSQKTKVSKAMLGQIERSESNPTIAILWKIATGFQVSFSSFLVVEGTQSSTALQNTDLDSQATLADHQGMQVETLFPFSPDTAIETLRVTLSPNHIQHSAAHNDGVIEHIVVLEGTLALHLANEQYILTEGQTLRFNADQPHRYVNCEGEVCTRFHNIISYL